MSFAALRYLWILIFCAALFVAGIFLQKKRQRALSTWVKPDLWSLLIPEYSKNRFVIKWIFLCLSLSLILFSLLRPQWGEHEELVDSKGMDIMFMLDLSNSMLAEDVNPSRLSRAQLLIKKTLQLLPDDRVGTVGFAGKAFVAIPLTTDFGYVAEIIDSLNPDAITQQGTDIGEAIDVSIKAFERGAADTRLTSRAMILITDGEDFGKTAEQAAAKVKEYGAGFFVFGVGTSEGSPIPLRNEVGILQTYKKDRAGKTVISRPNFELLNKVANAAGGKFFELTNVDDAAYILSKQLLSFHRDSTKEQRQVVKIDRFQLFLGLGVFFFVLYLFCGYRITPLTTAFAFVLFGFSVQSVAAQTLGGYWKNKRGIQLYDDKSYEDSAKTFEAARTKDSDNPILEFNEATAFAKGQKNEDAIFHYEEATKKALNQGDFETATKSLYNEGVLQKDGKNFNEAYRQLTNAIEMAKISNQPELEKKAREALVQAVQEQQQQQQQKQSDQKNSDSKKESSDKKDSKDSKDKEGKDQSKPNQQPMEDGKKREFKSGTLSKDVAEGIMNDLSDREKQLYQRLMKDKKNKETHNDQDW